MPEHEQPKKVVNNMYCTSITWTLNAFYNLDRELFFKISI